MLLGDEMAHRLPVRLVHGVAATIFAGLGAVTLLNVGNALWSEGALADTPSGCLRRRARISERLAEHRDAGTTEADSA
jgi:hypothetical protein